MHGSKWLISLIPVPPATKHHIQDLHRVHPSAALTRCTGQVGVHSSPTSLKHRAQGTAVLCESRDTILCIGSAAQRDSLLKRTDTRLKQSWLLLQSLQTSSSQKKKKKNHKKTHNRKQPPNHRQKTPPP